MAFTVIQQNLSFALTLQEILDEHIAKKLA